MTPEQTVEVAIGLWDMQVPRGENPPRLAAAILEALHGQGYHLVGLAGVPTARLRAMVKLLGHGEMTPTAKMMMLRLCDEYEPS